MAKSGLGSTLLNFGAGMAQQMPGMGGMGGGDGLSPMSGLNMIGNPSSGLGMLGTLLGGKPNGPGGTPPINGDPAQSFDPMDNLRRWSLGILADPILGKREAVDSEMARGTPVSQESPITPPTAAAPVAPASNNSQSIQDFLAAGGDYHDYPWKTVPDSTGHSLLDHGGDKPGYALDNLKPSYAMEDDTPIDVIAKDNWKPHKPTILGAIADAFLMSRGMQPAFSQNRNARDTRDAMQNFTTNPMQAIRRMSQIPGNEKTSWDLLDKQQDNERQNLAAEVLAETRKEKFRLNVAGRLQSISRAKDPFEAYRQTLPMMRKYMQMHGLDPSELPDEYNQDAINGWVGQSVTPEDQIRMEALEEYRRRRFEMEQTKEEGRNTRFEEGQDRQDARTDKLEGGRNERFNEGQDRQDARSKNGGQKAKSRIIETPYGPGVLSPDGETLGTKRGNKKVIWKRVPGKPGQWKEIGEI